MLLTLLVSTCACDRGQTPTSPAKQPEAAAAEGGEGARGGEGAQAEAGAETDSSKPAGSEGEAAADAASFAPPIDDPGAPQADPADRLDAPEAYERVAIRASFPIGPRYVDLVYEGNNKLFRRELNDEGLYRSGEQTAADWRVYAAGVGKLVVLRDSLFSQQDHPTLQAPRALMLSPTWVSVAIDASLRGASLVAPRNAEDIEDDAAWASEGEDIQAYFGSFPVSERLFTDGGRAIAGAEPAQQAMTRNARRSLQMLGAAAEAMIQASGSGPEKVAQVGADWIAASDRNYFGASLRRSTIIPIFVENPNEHESRDEGKGLVPWQVTLDPRAVELARQAIYGRRLLDGPLALERYDLRSDKEQSRAVALLEELVPRGSQGEQVWLWVNGGSDGHGKGEPATPYIARFREQLAAADIELDRVVLFSKPSIRPRGDDAGEQLAAALQAHAALNIPLSAQLRTKQLRALIEAASER